MVICLIYLCFAQQRIDSFVIKQFAFFSFPQNVLLCVTKPIIVCHTISWQCLHHDERKTKGIVSNRQNMRDVIVPMSLLSSAKRHLFGQYLAHFEQSLFFATNTSIPCQNVCQ